MLNYPKVLLFLALWTKFAVGSEEAVDFLASFSSQTKTSRVPYITEPIVQPETLAKNWLSLGALNSNGDSNSKRLKKATDSYDHPLGVLGNPNNLVTNEYFRQPAYQNSQPNEHTRSITTEIAANNYRTQISKPNNFHWMHIYNPMRLRNQGGNYQPSINSFESPKFTTTKKDKLCVSEIDLRFRTQEYKKQGQTSDHLKFNSDGQTVETKSSIKTLVQGKRKHSKKFKSLTGANLANKVVSRSIIKLENQQSLEFKKRLMKLLEPESPLIKLDFIQECVASLQRLKDNELGDSMLANLDTIKGQIEKHKSPPQILHQSSNPFVKHRPEEPLCLALL
ncbi:hypothetical protein BY996DRAFT_2317495 [Phakopsora pachyrhizi]|nr:hypothetical protein BY996DRAFT_2317495 [Phakopsora pachyrhizi]